MDKALKAVLQSTEGAVLDVGANIGQFLLKVKEYDPSRTYFAFEPNPPCIFYLYELIRLNRLNDTFVLPVASSIETKSNFLYSEAWDSGTSTLVEENAREDTSFGTTVFSMVGDDLVNSIGLEDLAYIKIDVEGFEYEVLRGLSNTLKSKRPVIFCEIWLEKLVDSNGNPSTFITDIHQYLNQHSYSPIGAKRDLSVHKIETLEDYQQMEFADFLFVPDEKVETLLKSLN